MPRNEGAAQRGTENCIISRAQRERDREIGKEKETVIDIARNYSP